MPAKRRLNSKSFYFCLGKKKNLSKEKLLNVSEFAELCNVTTETLRYYDREGLVFPDYINPDTGYRYYSPDTYKCVKVILALKNNNFSICDIKKLFKSWYTEKPYYKYIIESLQEQISYLTEEISILEKRRENTIGSLQSFLNHELFNKCGEIYEKDVDGFSALCREEYEEIETKHQLISTISSFEKVLSDVSEINSYFFSDNRYFALIRNYLTEIDHYSVEAKLGIILNNDINKELSNTQLVHFPSQKCVCLLHNGKIFDTLENIDRLLRYINDKKYKIIGDIRLRAVAGRAIISPCINMYYEIQIPVE